MGKIIAKTHNTKIHTEIHGKIKRMKKKLKKKPEKEDTAVCTSLHKNQAQRTKTEL